MRILLTNDDGIYAPGLAAMEWALGRLGDVYVVAPSREQSGVSHSITFLTPLMVKRVIVDDKPWGWAVDGSPADCVKLGIHQILDKRPDLVVSGINGGLNAGINILYSGTVGAAAEGAFCGVTSVAVSLEYDENEPFHRAAEIAVGVIGKILDTDEPPGRLYNMNIPLAALREQKPSVRVAEMDVTSFWETFERRDDPMGRAYYWLTGRPDPRRPKPPATTGPTDLETIAEGTVSLTPLDFDMTHRSLLERMKSRDFSPETGSFGAAPDFSPPSIRTTTRRT